MVNGNVTGTSWSSEQGFRNGAEQNERGLYGALDAQLASEQQIDFIGGPNHMVPHSHEATRPVKALVNRVR
jgi:hypothetical protein